MALDRKLRCLDFSQFPQVSWLCFEFHAWNGCFRNPESLREVECSSGSWNPWIHSDACEMDGESIMYQTPQTPQTRQTPQKIEHIQIFSPEIGGRNFTMPAKHSRSKWAATSRVADIPTFIRRTRKQNLGEHDAWLVKLGRKPQSPTRWCPIVS